MPYISYYKGIASSTQAFWMDLSGNVSSQGLNCAAMRLKALISFTDLAKKYLFKDQTKKNDSQLKEKQKL